MSKKEIIGIIINNLIAHDVLKSAENADQLIEELDKHLTFDTKIDSIKTENNITEGIISYHDDNGSIEFVSFKFGSKNNKN